MVRFLLERKKTLLALDSIPGRSHGIAVLFDNISQEVCFFGEEIFLAARAIIIQRGGRV